MVGANWSREELLAMTHAWGEALEVPPHRGFRLLEHMFRRFTELCGGATKRTVGSMEIKRKYMKNMAEVITQYDNALEQQRRSGGRGTTDGNQYGLPMRVPWFSMRRNERKEWFLRLNSKSYKFANIDKETYDDVQQLMQVERVVYGVDSVPEGEDAHGDHHADEKDEDDEDVSSAGEYRRIRVPLARNSAGYWETANHGGRSMRPRTTIDTFGVWAPPPSRTGGVSSTVSRQATRRGNDAFDRLIGSISGGDDTVMIAAGPWDNDSDSESDSSIGSDDGDADGYNWQQAKHMASLHFQSQREDVPGRKRSRTVGSVDSSSDTASHINSDDGDMGSVADRHRDQLQQQQQQQKQTSNPEFLRAVRSLEAQAEELKKLLIQERDERRQQQQRWTSETQRREREHQDATELIAQIRAVQDDNEQENGTRNEALALLRSEEEARQRDDQVMAVEQDDENQLMEELRRNADHRLKFDKALEEARDEDNAFMQDLQRAQSESHRRRTECMDIVKEIKLIQGKDGKGSSQEGDLESQSSGGKVEADDSVKQVNETTTQNQDAGTSRPARRSSAPPTDRKGAELSKSPLRTRSGQVRAKGNSR